jgi:beta-carotene hydroxylase
MDTTCKASLQLNSFQQAIEVVRPWLLFIMFLITAKIGWWIIAVPLSIITCLAAFVQMHDAIHRSLGLSQRSNEILLVLSGLLLLKSGHCLQITHLRHHGRCLKEDDPEGAPAKWPLYKVIIDGPFHIFTLRFIAIKIAPHTLRIQIIETLLTILVVSIALIGFFKYGSMIGIVYWISAAIISATMPLWAAYIPHRMASTNPIIKKAGSLAQVWTPIISSFAYHHAHHQFPKIPTALLPLAVKQNSYENKSDHEHVHS